MSETSKRLDTSAETNIGPDLFCYYIRGIEDLLSRDDDFLPFSSTATELVGMTSENMEVADRHQTCKENKGPVGYGSLFCNAAGSDLFDFEKERLKAMLRQCVLSLTREVDEMLDPVIGMHQLRGVMGQTNFHGNSEDDSETRAKKKLKISSSSSSITIPLDTSPVSFSREGFPNEFNGVNFHETDKSKQNTEPNAPKGNESSSNKNPNGSISRSHIRDEKESGEVNDDLQVLLENKGPKVEEKMEKYSAELSSTLDRMEEKLEELLDIVISSCRPMTLPEKHELRRLIQKLPSKNLDRVAEIIHRRKPSEKLSSDEIHVDLQHEDNATLWRLYFYVAAVQNARKLLG